MTSCETNTNLDELSDEEPSDKIKFKDFFGIDIRSLALLRIAMAVLIIIDLIIRIPDSKTFYTDEGLFPRSLAFVYTWHPFASSIYHISGNITVHYILFLISGLFAFALLIGYKTRLATFASWFFLISLHVRNDFVITGGDFVLRLLLFWSMFVPLGACYSVDSSLSPVKPKNYIASFGTLGLLAQAAIVYWFSVLWKTKYPEWLDGSAIFLSLSVDHYAKPFAELMLKLPKEYLSNLTHFTYYLEIVAPLLLFIPIKKPRIKCLAILSLIILQLSFFSCFTLGFFPWSNLAALAPFLPAWFWNNVINFLKKKEKLKIKILYNESSDLWRKIALIIRIFFLLPETEIIPGKENTSENNPILILDQTDSQHVRFNAIKVICNASPILWVFLPVFQFRPVRYLGSIIYNQLCKNKNLSEKISHALEYKPLNIRISKPLNLIALFFIFYSVMWNLTSIGSKYSIQDKYKWLGLALVIDQHWAMFTPVNRYGCWYVIPAKLKDGTIVDLFRDGTPVNWDKPKSISALYKNRHWSAYLINLGAWWRHGIHFPYWANHLCKTWNKNHPENKKIESFEIYMRYEYTIPQEAGNTDKTLLWKQSCSK